MIDQKVLDFFHGDKLAAQVWTSKYDALDGTPEQSINREVKELNRINQKLGTIPGFEDLYPWLKNYGYISTGGSVKAGLGVNLPISISNCFVVSSPEDSITGIQKTEEEIEQICKRRGGCGVDLSTLRPDGAAVNNSAKSSTGVVPVADKYSAAIQFICQKGRRGALMISLDYLHPDVVEFVKAKLDLKRITGANISVRVNGEDLYQRADNDEDLILRFPIDLPIDENDPDIAAMDYGVLYQWGDKSEKQWIKKIHARDLENLIAQSACKSAEPGCLFWDTIIKESVPDVYPEKGFRTTSTNPCGEIPLNPGDSCRLTSINWFKFVDNPYTDKACINSETIKNATIAGIITLDNIAELELEKVSKILEICEEGVEKKLWENIYNIGKTGRRLGLGPTGIADMLAALNIPYDSNKAIELCGEIQKIIAKVAYDTSHKLAKLRGNIEFINIDKELNNSRFIMRLALAIQQDGVDAKELLRTRRNISMLTAAPNGTNAMMMQVSSGIEPVFKIVMNRAVVLNPGDNIPESRIVTLDGVKKYIVRSFHPGFIRWYSITRNITEEEAREVLENELTEKEVEEAVKESPYYNSTSYDIDPIKKAELQGTLQKWIDHSISVTHNLPKGTTFEDVKKLYRKAYKSGCKGVTVYVDGSRTGVLDVKVPEAKDKKDYKRPKILPCRIVRFTNNKEKWYGFISERDGKPYEIFTAPKSAFKVDIPDSTISGRITKVKYRLQDDAPMVKTYILSIFDKEGNEVTIGDVSRVCEREYFNYGRLMSGLLRHDMPMEALLSTLEHLNFDNEGINSWKSGVMRAFKVYLQDGVTEKICPVCKSKLRRESGCLVCDHCGYSACS